MKTKEKEKKDEKKRKEAKRKRLCAESNSGTPTLRAKGLPLGHVGHRRRYFKILSLKPSSLIKREFKDIFQKNQKNDCSETQRRCISSHLHVNNGSPTA